MTLSGVSSSLEDFWDPNTWDTTEPEHRIYTDDKDQLVFAVVDYIDYIWAIKWKWRTKISSNGKNFYIYRTLTNRRYGIHQSLYLHVEIMKRTGIKPPTKKHVLVDHRTGHTLNCRRPNLRWATHSMNSRNRNGSTPHDMIEG